MSSSTTGRQRADVVVVGARCAGAATAMLLARHGLRVVVLDRAELGTDALSAHALMRAGVLQLHRWGLLDEVVRAGTPPVRHTVFRYRAGETSVTLKPVAGVDALYAPRRTVLDPILVDAAREASVDVRFGATVTRLLRTADGRVRGVGGRGRDGAPFEVEADLTIGADGVGSRVARLAEAPVERRAAGGSGLVCGHVAGFEGDAYEWIYRQGVVAGVVPTNDGAACVFVGVPPDRLHRELADGLPTAFGRLLLEAAPDLADRVAWAGAPARLHSFPGTPGRIRRPWGAGWALVGDAGHFEDPLGAHGISNALRDAELLARAVVAGHDDPATAAARLHDYHQTRNRLSANLFATTERIACYRWDDETIPGLLRRLAAAMTDEVAHLTSLDRPVAVGPVG